MNDIDRLIILARHTLWLAYAHCDLIHDENHVQTARKKASEQGISNFDEANKFLDSLEGMVVK